MSDIKNDIHKWLNNDNIRNSGSLKTNINFITFLKEKYPHQTEEELLKQILRCSETMNDIRTFSDCLNAALKDQSFRLYILLLYFDKWPNKKALNFFKASEV